MEIKQKLADLCRRYQVADLYVFGSRAREIEARLSMQPAACQGSDADVDIGILPERMQAWTPAGKVDMAAELEDLFRVNRVDLVFLPEADPFLAADIIGGKLLYTGDPDRQAEYELYVLRRAGDLMPLKKERIRMILEEGAR